MNIELGYVHLFFLNDSGAIGQVGEHGEHRSYKLLWVLTNTPVSNASILIIQRVPDVNADTGETFFVCSLCSSMFIDWFWNNVSKSFNFFFFRRKFRVGLIYKCIFLSTFWITPKNIVFC